MESKNQKKTIENTFLNLIYRINYIFIEAENTASNLQKWTVVNNEDKNYVKGASNNRYLEFVGNKPITDNPNSLLAYNLQHQRMAILN